MNEEKKKISPEFVAAQGLMGFLGYKLVGAMVASVNVTGSGTFASAGGALSVLSIAGAPWFVPLGFFLMTVPLAIKVSGTIRKRYIMKESDFPRDGWYQEHVLENSNRKDEV